jgi:hypothetical protein
MAEYFPRTAFSQQFTSTKHEIRVSCTPILFMGDSIGEIGFARPAFPKENDYLSK